MPIRGLPKSPRRSLPALAACGAFLLLALAWIWPLRGMAHDLFVAHMLQHLLMMNGAALLIALATAPKRLRPDLPLAAAVQTAALWVWHTPKIFAAAHHSAVLQFAMQVSLFGVALFFWWAVLDRQARPLWQRVFALLITAKLFCLLGAIFIFSRRALFAETGNPHTWGLTALEDQQLAGLLMVSACTLIYVAMAITLFARYLFTAEPVQRNAHARILAE